MQNVSFTPSRRALEFGIYRDGDNNLDAIQEATLSQALRTSQQDSRIEFTVEDTTALRGGRSPFDSAQGDNRVAQGDNRVAQGDMRSGPGDVRSVQGDVRSGQGDRVHTEQYRIVDGDVVDPHVDRAHDMSDEANLSRFVARTLDNAEASGAKQTWIDLVDHGGGDGGGLEVSNGSLMSMPDMAKAIADGVALHAKEHPEDAGRGVDGVVANQCLMDTMGFAEGYYIRALKRPVPKSTSFRQLAK